MSKYTIKLEQFITTEQFGDIAITIQYDAKGPKIISINGENLTEDLLAQVEPFFNMYNFCLTKGIPPIEISDFFLATKPTQANKLLNLILNEIKSAPNTIQTVKADDVLEIDLHTLKMLSN
jgi:hypothetical protein